MIYLTGDIHAEARRLTEKRIDIYNGVSEQDTVIVCGDFGLVWSGSATENDTLDVVSGRKFTTLFVDGNHENFDLLAQYPIEQWNGGKVHRIRPNILHLMRGQVFTIEGKPFFTMGGASSHDIDHGILEPDHPDFYEMNERLHALGALYRVNHYSWWKEELPSSEELDEGRANLAAHGWAVDYILSHCAPTHITAILDGGTGEYKADTLTDYFDEIAARCKYKHWFFGHYHRDINVTEQFVLLYRQYLRLTEESQFTQSLDKEFLERGLPPYLQADIDALVMGRESKSSVLDCLYDEVQGSINSAFYGNLISKAQAAFLRKKYLGLEESNNVF